MSIKIPVDNIKNVKLGSEQIKKVMLGTNLVWQYIDVANMVNPNNYSNYYPSGSGWTISYNRADNIVTMNNIAKNGFTIGAFSGGFKQSFVIGNYYTFRYRLTFTGGTMCPSIGSWKDERCEPVDAHIDGVLLTDEIINANSNGTSYVPPNIAIGQSFEFQERVKYISNTGAPAGSGNPDTWIFQISREHNNTIVGSYIIDNITVYEGLWDWGVSPND